MLVEWGWGDGKWRKCLGPIVWGLDSHVRTLSVLLADGKPSKVMTQESDVFGLTLQESNLEVSSGSSGEVS